MLKPDFMAEGPRVAIKENITIEDDDVDYDEPDAVSILDPDSRFIHYYYSDKVLGHLFRAIDERKFLDVMHRRAREHKKGNHLPERGPMTVLWDYVSRTTLNIQWMHHKDVARRIQDK